MISWPHTLGIFQLWPNISMKSVGQSIRTSGKQFLIETSCSVSCGNIAVIVRRDCKTLCDNSTQGFLCLDFWSLVTVQKSQSLANVLLMPTCRTVHFLEAISYTDDINRVINHRTNNKGPMQLSGVTSLIKASTSKSKSQTLVWWHRSIRKSFIYSKNSLNIPHV